MGPWVGLVAVLGFLALLGRLKLLYYYRAFGVELGSLDLSVSDQLFESWFVAQNLLVTGLLWWVALKTRVTWVVCVTVLHALLPIASHYAFVFHEAPLAAWLIDYRHTLMKLVPFAVLGVVWLFHPRRRKALGGWRSPWPAPANVLLAIVLLSWAISSAKHFGSFDANLVLHEPQTRLARVRLGLRNREPGVALPSEAYLLHANRDSLLLWDPAGFVYGRTDRVRTLVVPRTSVVWIEGTQAFRVQPGNRFL